MPAKLKKASDYLKVRSIRATDEQWARWSVKAKEVGYESVHDWIRQKLDMVCRKGL